MHGYLMSLFKAIRMLIWVSSLAVVLLDIVLVDYMYRGKVQGKSIEDYVGVFFSRKVVLIACQFVLILGIFFSPFVFHKFQNTDIGSFLEKESYREQYYVYVRENHNAAKSYKLEADIIKGDYGYPSYADEGEETFVVKGNGYFVEKVYWGNGGYLTFLKDDDWLDAASHARIYPGVETKVTDCHDNDYYITLTTEKAE